MSDERGPDSIREAARRWLSDKKRRPSQLDGVVSRLTMDITVAGRSELVTVALRDEQLACSSSAKDADAHIGAALKWLASSSTAPVRSETVAASDEGGASQDLGGKTVRTVEVESPLHRVSIPPSAPDSGSEAPSMRARLADALEDVVTVIVRAGTGGAVDSPSVTASLERLRKEAPLPIPTGLARWLGRLRASLDGETSATTARLLDGASQVAVDLRRDRPDRSARRRAAAWLGSTGEQKITERVSDRTLIEVARERLRSSERSGIERRYLVDAHNGEIFREERSKGSVGVSIGPCPRRIQVGLAEVEDGAAPRRIRPMQYVVSLEVPDADLRRIEASAYRRFAALADRYREQVAAHPGQAEPFAIVVPKSWDDDETPLGFDADGSPLPFTRADDPAAVDVLRELVPKGGPRWIAGRLIDVDGALMMLPCTVAVPDGDGTRIHRLR